jgi:hypothetical protein
MICHLQAGKPESCGIIQSKSEDLRAKGTNGISLRETKGLGTWGATDISPRVWKPSDLELQCP